MTPPFRLRKRKVNTEKRDYGHVLVLAGSRGMSGAAVMVAKAALRAGAGLVTVGVPKAIYPIVARQMMEGMVKPLAATSQGALAMSAWREIRAWLPKVTACAIGPGLSVNPATQRLVHRAIASLTVPMVLDADGINAFRGQAKGLRNAKAPIIVTPHQREAARLLGLSEETIERQRRQIAAQAAKTYNVVFVLKGHRTVVSTPDGRVSVNQTGNPGMATAGSGDVLTGVIVGLLAQGLPPFDAARLGVYAHGLAGDLAAKKVGQTSLIASDILDALPSAFKKLQS